MSIKWWTKAFSANAISSFLLYWEQAFEGLDCHLWLLLHSFKTIIGLLHCITCIGAYSTHFFVTTCHWAWKTNGGYYVDFIFWKFFLPSFCLNARVVVALVVVVGGGGSLSLLIIRLLWSVPGNNVSMSIATSAASSSLQLARHYIKNDANKKIEIIVV